MMYAAVCPHACDDAIIGFSCCDGWTEFMYDQVVTAMLQNQRCHKAIRGIATCAAGEGASAHWDWEQKGLDPNVAISKCNTEGLPSI